MYVASSNFYAPPRAHGLAHRPAQARERVGGRLLNEAIGDGKVVEVGGQWIGPTQDRIAALAAELGVGTFPTYDEGRHVIEISGKRASCTGALTDARVALVRDLSRAISPLALIDFEQARARLDSMARQVPLEAPWMAPKAMSWGGQTFATWVRRNTRTAAARSLFELATEAVWAAEPAHVSLLHVLFYTHSGSGFNTLVGTGGGAQQDRCHGGSQRMPQGTVIKTMAVYKRPFWREEGLSGQATSDVGPAGVVFDNSPPDGSPGVLLGFLEGRLPANGAHARQPSDERRSSPVTRASSASGRGRPSASSSGSGPKRSGPVERLHGRRRTVGGTGSV
jgi:monoamine oxidase